MSNEFPISGGVKMQFGVWPTVAVYVTNNFPVGYEVNVGFGDANANPVAGLRSVAVVATYPDDASFQAASDAAGGVGHLISSLKPAINAALAQYFDTHPNLGPPITNTDPCNFQTFNTALAQYFTLVPPAGATHPVMSQKSYP